MAHTPGGHETYKASYVLDKTTSPNVGLLRIEPANLEPNGQKRGADGAVGPSLLSQNYRPIERAKSIPLALNAPKTTISQQLLNKTFMWKRSKKGIHPIEIYFKRNSRFLRGYLRERQAKSENHDIGKQKQLSAYEWDLVMKMQESLDC